MPERHAVDVEFIDFDDIRNGIPKDIGVIINVGDAYTAFSGAENWIDEKGRDRHPQICGRGRRLHRRGRAHRLPASGAVLPAVRRDGRGPRDGLLVKHRQIQHLRPAPLYPGGY